MIHMPPHPALDESGTTTIEYTLIASLIAVVLVVAVTALSDVLGDTFNTTSDAVAAATGG
ncbi:MAG: Flp family type IVb pilin [Deltaproteobacteria bacterium]|nr:Flp family type IVb pilin [Deltaproteobacteria bacterium]